MLNPRGRFRLSTEGFRFFHRRPGILFDSRSSCGSCRRSGSRSPRLVVPGAGRRWPGAGGRCLRLAAWSWEGGRWHWGMALGLGAWCWYLWHGSCNWCRGRGAWGPGPWVWVPSPATTWGRRWILWQVAGGMPLPLTSESGRGAGATLPLTRMSGWWEDLWYGRGGRWGSLCVGA